MGRVYQFVAMPLGLATSLSGFTSSVEEVRKVGFEVGHLSAHFPFFDPSVKVHLRWFFPGNYVIAYLPLIP